VVRAVASRWCCSPAGGDRAAHGCLLGRHRAGGADGRRASCSADGRLVADRGNARRLLLALPLPLRVPPLVLAACWRWAASIYPLLIATGLAAGSIGAFAVPTRDALLPPWRRATAARRGARDRAAVHGQLIGIAAPRSRSHRRPATPARHAFSCWSAPSPVAVPIRRRILPPASELLAQHCGRHRRGRELRADLAGAAAQTSASVSSMSDRYGRVARSSCATLSRQRRRDRYVNLASGPARSWPLRLRGLCAPSERRGRLVVGAVLGRRADPVCMALQPPFLVLNGLCFVWDWRRHHPHPESHRAADRGAADPSPRADVAGSSSASARRPDYRRLHRRRPAAVLGLKLAMVLPALAMVVLMPWCSSFSRVLDDALRSSGRPERVAWLLRPSVPRDIRGNFRCSHSPPGGCLPIYGGGPDGAGFRRAFGQAYPTRPIRLVGRPPAGAGVTDIMRGSWRSI